MIFMHWLVVALTKRRGRKWCEHSALAYFCFLFRLERLTAGPPARILQAMFRGNITKEMLTSSKQTSSYEQALRHQNFNQKIWINMKVFAFWLTFFNHEDGIYVFLISKPSFKPGTPAGTFLKSFGCIHLVRSPWKAFVKGRQSLEDDWMNLLSFL